ncbi:MAG: hypothetical protein ING00_10065 [Roseomonas sp.]|nr:hypothetical protein [Roseomonas sp.]MCA3306132.1 hypothetical protein [Roseomonas sp.]
MSDSKRFARRRAMLGLGVTVLAAGMSCRASAASRAALEALAVRLEALGEDGLDPHHYDLWDAALARAIPVRLHYDTEIVEIRSVVMRRDVYGLDAAYLRALDAPRSQRLAEASLRP